MTYSALADITLLTGEGWLDDSNSGIITKMIDIAFLDVKSSVASAGLTAPDADDVLKVAEINYVIAELIRRGWLRQSLGVKDNYDNINKAVKHHRDIGFDKITGYITANRTAVEASDTDGQDRVDLYGTQFSLHQGDLSATGGFTNDG